MNKEVSNGMKGRVIFDPRCRLAFAGNYIMGFEELFGKRNVHFRMHPFRDLVQKGDEYAFDHYCALIVERDGYRKKVVVDYRDKISFNDRAYHWCDLYAKVNMRAAGSEKKYLEKSIAIGPEVAPRIWGWAKTGLMFVANYLRSYGFLGVGFRAYLSGYTWTRRRPLIDAYAPGESEGDYLYFDSSLWPLKYGAESSNKWRGLFIRTCKGMDINFHGGFYAHIKHPDIEPYRDLILEEYIPQKEYMRRIKRSAFAFNSPSCHGGHGWKLAEFMAMGKAILSSPLENDMPEPLEHGVNAHIIQSEDEMEEAINLILKDTEYRNKLEQGSRDYFENFLAPASVAERIVLHLK